MGSMAESGAIARIVGDRGFGFIRDARGQELFFHATSVEGAAFDELREGRGDRAAHVRPGSS